MLVGKQAPDFSCKAIIDGDIKDFSLKDTQGYLTVLCFYPLDFSFVCPTELQAFQVALPEFKKRNAEVLAISVDSAYSHLMWLDQPKEKGGIAGISYPLLSDITKSISRMYGVLNEDAGVAFRALFIIDKNNIVQSMQVNNMSLGRNIQEVLRLVDAVDFVQTHGEVCPANWTLGEQGLMPTRGGLSDYFSKK